MTQNDLDELQTAQRLRETRAQTSMDKGVDAVWSSVPCSRAVDLEV